MRIRREEGLSLVEALVAIAIFGMLLGVIGMWAMLFQNTNKFFLFISMYFVHVFFFIQYRAFDLDVFFIPAHMLWAAFIAFGLFEIIATALLIFKYVGATARHAYKPGSVVTAGRPIRTASRFASSAISIHVLSIAPYWNRMYSWMIGSLTRASGSAPSGVGFHMGSLVSLRLLRR